MDPGRRDPYNYLKVPPTQEVDAVRFSFYTAEQIRKLSVKKITTEECYDKLGNPIEGGPFDPAFGVFNMKERCTTCSLTSDDCPGHMGHIDLVLPVIHPITFPRLLQLLKSMCWNCHTIPYDRKNMKYIVKQFKYLDAGEIGKAHEMRIKRKNLRLKAAGFKLTTTEEKGDDTEEQDDEESDDEDNEEEQESDKKNKQKSKKKDTVVDDLDSDDDNTQAEYDPASRKYTHIEVLRAKWIKKLLAHGCRKCPNCEFPLRKIRSERGTSKIFLMALAIKEQAFMKERGYQFHGQFSDDLDEDMEVLTERKQHQRKASPGRIVTATEAKYFISKLFEKEKEAMNVLFGEKQKGPDGKYGREANLGAFFVETLAVLPPRFRPASMLEGRMTFHTQNKSLDAILTANRKVSQVVRDIDRLKKMKDDGKDPILIHWTNLQKAVNQSFDMTSGATLSQKAAGPGVKQILEKKQGLFRMNMMGKRVNFAARTVISPDAMLQTNEIGVPQYFAENLTFKQPVTAFNYKEMAQLVVNGPNYPGATVVEDEFGNKTQLEHLDEAKRVGISKTLLTPSDNAPPGSVKKVWRNLQDGDFVLMNRQPTLHKPSIMAHKAKIIRSSDRVLRMHYANCATYNADFDGDEMNLHFPQNFVAQAEARQIAATNHQYIVPRNGLPLRGLIQDYVVSGALLTKRDTFFTRAEFQKLLYSALFNVNTNIAIQMPPPAILKPVPLWTGKQAVTATLNQITHGSKPITLEMGTKIPVKLWGSAEGPWMNEGIVYVRENELMCGVLDKNQFGASAFGLVHCVYEVYGPDTAGVVLSTLSRLFVNYFMGRAFTCGIDDLLIKTDAGATRRSLLDSTNELGRATAAQFLGQDTYDKKDAQKQLNAKLTTEREIARLDSMMKGKLHPVTSSVISTCIPNGQMKLFPDNNFSMMTVSGAKGSQVNFSQVSCLLGQQELEGKRVPRMASGKTLPSFEPFDPTARAGGFIMDRFLTGIRPQEYFFHCMAGREGLIDTAVKTARSGYLQRCLVKNLENLVVHYDGTVRDNSDNSVVQFYYGEDALDVVKTGFINNPKFSFFALNYQILAERLDLASVERVFQESEEQSHELWKAYGKEVKKEKGKPIAEPPMAQHSPGTHLGAVSARFHEALEDYISKNPDKALSKKGPLTHDVFRQLMWLKYQACLVDPGECVGLLAAQSVGEPSTQMTLNTFHLAGRGEANVTLGVPRLREIIMTASKEISTPMTDVTMKDPTNKAAAESFANLLQPITATEIVDTITTEEYIDKERFDCRNYKITLAFTQNYRDLLKERHFNQKDLYSAIWQVPVKVQRMVDMLRARSGVSVSQRTKSGGDNDDAGGDDDDEAPTRKKDDEDDNEVENEEDGALAEKAKKQKSEQSYEEDEADEAIKKLADAKDAEEENETEIGEGEEGDEKDRKRAKKTDEEMEEDEEEKTPKSKAEAEENIRKKREAAEAKHNIKLSKDRLSMSFTISVPLESRKLLMVSIVEKVLEKHFVKLVKGITRALVAESDKKGPNGEKLYSVQTEGVNFATLHAYADLININALYSNHIYAISQTYGVEAARALIMKEMHSVFKVYDITVDWRHLGLIADFMTFGGGFRGMNRGTMGMSASPFQKMTYESATKFLSEAAVLRNADIDTLKSTSSRIVMGNLVRSGTGLFSIGVKVDTPAVSENYDE